MSGCGHARFVRQNLLAVLQRVNNPHNAARKDASWGASLQKRYLRFSLEAHFPDLSPRKNQ